MNGRTIKSNAPAIFMFALLFFLSFGLLFGVYFLIALMASASELFLLIYFLILGPFFDTAVFGGDWLQVIFYQSIQWSWILASYLFFKARCRRWLLKTRFVPDRVRTDPGSTHYLRNSALLVLFAGLATFEIAFYVLFGISFVAVWVYVFAPSGFLVLYNGGRCDRRGASVGIRQRSDIVSAAVEYGRQLAGLPTQQDRLVIPRRVRYCRFLQGENGVNACRF